MMNFLLFFVFYTMHSTQALAQVSNGQPVNAAVTNAAFVYKKVGDTMTGPLNITNGPLVVAGVTVGTGNFVLKTGDTMSGDLSAPNFSAQTGGGYELSGIAFLGVGSGIATNNTLLGISAGPIMNPSGGGNRNTCVGREACLKLTTGAANSFYGYQSGHEATSSTASAFFGEGSGFNTTTASDNTGFGDAACSAPSTGGFNTCVGASSGPLGASNANNTAIGYNAQITGSNQIVIGANSTSSGSKSIAIGAPASVSASSSVQLGLGTNATDRSLQFNGYNFLTDLGALTVASERLTGLTSVVLVTDSGQNIVSGGATPTELSYLSGATSNIQSQINSKASSIAGSGSITVSSALGSLFTISVTTAASSSNGILTQNDWTTFNAKAPSFNQGSLSVTSPIALSGIASVIGTGATISVSTSGNGTTGILTAADWSTFNGKQANLGFTPVNKAGDTMTGTLQTTRFQSTSSSASLPSLDVSGNGGNGIYNGGTNIVAFSTNSTQAMTIGSNQVVNVLATNDSTTTANGALVVTGGVGIGKTLTAATVNVTGLTSRNFLGTDASGQITNPGYTPVNKAGDTMTGGLIYNGITASSDAPAGTIGEYVETKPSGNVTPASTGAWISIATATLPPGDWDVEGVASLATGGTFAGTQMVASISTTAGGSDSLSHGGFQWLSLSSGDFPVSQNEALNTGTRRILIGATTNVYLAGQLTYTTLGTAAYGSTSILRARRVR